MTARTLSTFTRLLLASGGLFAQSVGAQNPAAMPPSAANRAAIAAASAAEGNCELALVCIAEMQPPATADDIGKPGNANYDESKANPYPKLAEWSGLTQRAAQRLQRRLLSSIMETTMRCSTILPAQGTLFAVSRLSPSGAWSGGQPHTPDLGPISH